MSKTDEDIKRIRESAMKKLADALNEKLTEKYELGDGDLSISMFGSQTLLSDFDMHIFVKNRLLTDPQTGKDKTDELNSELESLVDQYFKTSFDKTLDEYKKMCVQKRLKNRFLNIFWRLWVIMILN